MVSFTLALKSRHAYTHTHKYTHIHTDMADIAAQVVILQVHTTLHVQMFVDTLSNECIADTNVQMHM